MGQPETGDVVEVIINHSNCMQCGAITAQGGRLTAPGGGAGPFYQALRSIAPCPPAKQARSDASSRAGLTRRVF